MSTEDNTSKAPDLTNVLNTVHGFLSLPEAELLYRLASEVPAGGTIVEIGSYQGRSTVCLGLGAKVNGARVYAIDPHDTEGDFGMVDNQCYYANIARFEVGDVVRTINQRSTNSGYGYTTDLLWIDGSHVYEDVEWDFRHYSRLVTKGGKIALHDTAGYHPGVTRALDEILAAGEWERVEMVDATSVLARVK